ncbi:MAG: GNAT family N-acetyltransferase [Lachnospiraceae bacterium]|nr:GNAT family N-acetyltransferase [Lachnospiraceae bacterium]
MKLVWISYEQIEYFRELVPPIYMDMMGLPNCFALGAVSEEDEYDVAAGIVIFTMHPGNRSVIQWFYVADAYENLGLGTDLLEAIHVMHKDTEGKKLSVLIGEDEVDKNDWSVAASFFLDRGFHRIKKLPGMWYFPVKRLLKQTFFDKALREEKLLGDVVAWKDLSEKERDHLLKACGEDLPKEIPNRATYDPEYSCVVRSAQGFAGVFLIRKGGNTCFPVLLKADSLEFEEKLVMAAMLQACERDDPDEKVMIMAYKLTTADKMDWYLPDVNGAAVVLLQEEV